MASPTRSSNRRASAALVVGIAAALVLPAAIVYARQANGVALLDAAWAIPVAFALGVTAWLLAQAGRARIRLSLERAGGAGRVRAARVLAVTGICLALSGAIAVGFYELLLRLEK